MSRHNAVDMSVLCDEVATTMAVRNADGWILLTVAFEAFPEVDFFAYTLFWERAVPTFIEDGQAVDDEAAAI